MNALLQRQGIPYLLIGVGRWGSMDRHLGIPSPGTRSPGPGSSSRRLQGPARHAVPGDALFQNLTSLNVGYFTINRRKGRLHRLGLARRAPRRRGHRLVRHVRLDAAVRVAMDGRSGRGIILKPAGS